MCGGHECYSHRCDATSKRAKIVEYSVPQLQFVHDAHIGTKIHLDCDGLAFDSGITTHVMNASSLHGDAPATIQLST